ncbi:hypothetical protein [Lewinella sp. IMCC34191]|uniref:hypothetical protein n=1 Tax=Lewinella sp. IMCC34191 TaxID=2259172 RepID=UPI001E64E53B|nr:hypothetical protein [Lewinella sp. IMCC34191]
MRCTSIRPIFRYFSALRRRLALTPRRRRQYIYDPDRTFVRRSPLTFARTVSLVVDLARQSLAVELGRFFRWRPEDIVTKSAFCQRRKAITPTFFKDLFVQTSRLFYRHFPRHRR